MLRKILSPGLLAVADCDNPDLLQDVPGRVVDMFEPVRAQVDASIPSGSTEA